jgi:hypothetical protein
MRRPFWPNVPKIGGFARDRAKKLLTEAKISLDQIQSRAYEGALNAPPENRRLQR